MNLQSSIPTLGVENKKSLLLNMKISTLLSIIMIFSSYANSYSQIEISLDIKNQPIIKVLDEIESETDLRFIFGSEIYDFQKLISISVEKAMLNEVIKLIFENRLSYDLDANVVFLKKSSEDQIRMNTVQTKSEVIVTKTNKEDIVQIIIEGKVTDNSGNPLPGASIIESGTDNGTTTDFDGNFILSVSQENPTLEISFIGFISQSVMADGSSNLSVILTPDIASLEEIVMVGYGSQKKKEVTSAVVSVDSEELNQSSVANISNALVGRLPGLIATQRGGQPGSNGSELLIRGISTTGNSAPLIIVDGVQRAFSQLDPNTIQTLTVLKDASAAAVYGVRGANGVILITTKRGESGKPTITYSSEITSVMPSQLPKYTGSFDYATLLNEAKRNEGKAEVYSADDLNKFRTGSNPLTHPDTDWFGEGLKASALLQQHNISISGGSDKVRYFVSGGALSEAGLIENTDYKRYNFRSNLDFDITSRLKVSLDLAGRQEGRLTPTSTVATYFSGLARTPPVFTAYYPNGLPGIGMNGENPIANGRGSGITESISNVFLANLKFEYKIPYIEGLTLKGYTAIDQIYQTTKAIEKKYDLYSYNETTQEYDKSSAGQSSISHNYFQGAPNSGSGVGDPTITYNATLNYDRTLGDIHHLTVLLGIEKAINESFSFNAKRLDLTSDALPQLDFADAGSAQNGGSAFNNARLGYLARGTYAYKEKYLFEAAFRYDASENFAKQNRFGFFPSFSAGWRIAEEQFMRDISFINELKLRGSWGKLGNDRISQFQYLDAFNFSGAYIVGGNPVQSIRPGVIPNEDVTWETATTTNIGFNLEVIDRKLGFEFDYFTKRTEDILQPSEKIVPSFVGASLPSENFGIVDNKGFEISTSYRNNVGNFNYWIRANYTKSENEIIEIGEPDAVPDNLKETGRSIGSRFGLIAEGFFQTQAELDTSPTQGPGIALGDIKYRDVNGDGTINDDDRDFIGVVSAPNVIYGFSLGGGYKGFDFSLQFQGARDFNTYLSEEAAFPFFNSGKVLEHHLDRWTPETPNARFPRVLSEDINNRVVSSFWLKNANYIRLKNVEIGYNFSNELISKYKLSKLRLYVSGLNIFTISDIENFDPEVPSGRGWFYPQTKSFTAGINVSF
tara:strand:- start:5196 stop:8600 length:3405 start_codon:yes stop_codon:yes gene_type:complete